MKKLVLLVLLFATLIALVGCENTEQVVEDNVDVATQEDIDLLQEHITEYQNQIVEYQSELDTLFATIALLEDIIFENERRLNELEEKLLADELLNETLHVDSVYFTIEAVIVDGLWTQMTVCEIFDGECEIEYPNDEQEWLITNGNRDDTLQELIDYGKFLDSVYEALS